jgi:hypothetical protein
MKQWFRRFAEVPGITYTANPLVNRSRLPGWNTVPRVTVQTWEGKRQEELWWRSPEGETTASPAHRWRTPARPGESVAQTAQRQLLETLELPGVVTDYHFALQACIESLWKCRRTEARVWGELERLCWLDLQLIEAYPGPFAIGERFVAIRAFPTLIRMYEREGYLHEALDVAQRAATFGQDGAPLEALQKRVARLEEEDAYRTADL